MSTIFDEEEEDNIVDLDEESDKKIKRNLHKALNHYWDAPLDHSLIAMLLDPRCKSMTKLDNWERDKAISLLREEYNSICIKNENITDLPNNEPNENQMQLFSIMFGTDITPQGVRQLITAYLNESFSLSEILVS
ncbi:22544_t:CDS:2 [Gigaspora rosea]|nr:22544_t:CDS:2 [Gigaspora rosea]